MKHIVQSLAMLDAASRKLEIDINTELIEATLKIEQKYAFARRMLKDARKSQEQRLLTAELIKEDYFGELKAPTEKSTTLKMRKSLAREKERRSRYA